MKLPEIPQMTGPEFRENRQAMAITQAELAQALECSESTIYRIEGTKMSAPPVYAMAMRWLMIHHNVQKGDKPAAGKTGK